MKIQLILRKGLFILFLLSSSFSALAQRPGMGQMKKLEYKFDKSGYVITTSGDTVQCKFDFNYSRVNYLPNGATVPTKIIGKEIKQYYISGDKYPYGFVPMPGAPNGFFKLLLKGRINLYHEEISRHGSPGIGFMFNGVTFGAGYTSNTIHWYAVKGNGAAVELKSEGLFEGRRRKKSILLSMIADKPEVVDFFNEAEKYSFELVWKTIYYYNTGQKAEVVPEDFKGG